MAKRNGNREARKPKKIKEVATEATTVAGLAAKAVTGKKRK